MTMKSSLAQVVEKKKTRKSQLEKLRNSLIVILYVGLARNERVKDIQKKLIEQGKQQNKKGEATNEKMVKTALILASSLKKKVGNKSFVEGYVQSVYGEDKTKKIKDAALFAIFAFTLLNKEKVEAKLSKEITKDVVDFETKIKDVAIEECYDYNRHLENPRVFYLASRHDDSAKDHEPYQGKMYIDEKWSSVIQSEELKDEVRAYISKNDVKTVQWVMGKPVWFITRPNCRHYFTVLPTSEVLKTSRTKLLKKHNMSSPIGDREYLQTMKGNRNVVDKKRNAEIMIKKYEERLELHQSMYDKEPTSILRDAIGKDKMLIKKWKEYLK